MSYSNFLLQMLLIYGEVERKARTNDHCVLLLLEFLCFQGEQFFYFYFLNYLHRHYSYIYRYIYILIFSNHLRP